ncbi:protein Wnt-8b [Dromiciops gliroides]|uniref:protein Wnt-8b n=1 Tax=Dromiciops gliroides TaxID=33562 RepID=UPI001CC74F6E|nr:protein Wnt-8b [Dromiciops gliroides]
MGSIRRTPCSQTRAHLHLPDIAAAPPPQRKKVLTLRPPQQAQAGQGSGPLESRQQASIERLPALQELTGSRGAEASGHKVPRAACYHAITTRSGSPPSAVPEPQGTRAPPPPPPRGCRDPWVRHAASPPRTPAAPQHKAGLGVGREPAAAEQGGAGRGGAARDMNGEGRALLPLPPHPTPPPGPGYCRSCLRLQQLTAPDQGSANQRPASLSDAGCSNQGEMPGYPSLGTSPPRSRPRLTCREPPAPRRMNDNCHSFSARSYVAPPGRLLPHSPGGENFGTSFGSGSALKIAPFVSPNGVRRQRAPIKHLLLCARHPCQTLRLMESPACIFLFTCVLQLSHTWSVNNFLMTGPKAYLIYSSSVAAGAQSGIEECKYQFAWDRWNCPERALQLSSHGGLRSANRETAFVHAISSAGVMYTLTRNCSLGDFDNCGCDDSRNGQLGGQGWLWGGCSDNVGFGEAISKQFVDALETGQDARAAMNLHNNEAGRKAVKATMKRTCKCHGVSGSCTTQTCWLQLPEFREVGAHLKEKYHAALKVELLQGAGNSAAGRGAIADTFRAISTRELVHLEDSPDYCLENKTLGLPGTEGRECLRRGRALGRWERRSCRRLCGDCGLAVEQRRAETVTSCNCKFHWCCAVRCEQCRRRVTKYFCSRAGGERLRPRRRP